MTRNLKKIPPIACDHIALFYQLEWEGHKCLAFQLLRKGYKQCSNGLIEQEFNNIFEVK